MLPFFTNPYPDELIYSAIARYHFYSGNIDCKDTLEELFQSRSVIPSVEIGSHFSVLAEQLGSNYSVENILANHTIYPYYAIFLSKQRQQEILQDVAGDGKGLYTRLGVVAGSICRKDGLYYCGECAKADLNRYGEPYIHREHQLQGIEYCPHHELSLLKYEAEITSRTEYIRFEIDKMNLSPIYKVDPYANFSVHLAKQVYKLLQLSLHQLSREEITLKYRALLREKNLVTVSNRLRQKELYQGFRSKFPTDFLNQHESDLDINNEYNWLKIITRNSKRHVHPFRHLLTLYFLEQGIDDFVNSKADEGPFGTGPFPCLNKGTTHYNQRVIQDVEVTRDYKTNSPIGTFTCSCGFVYARKGPDISLEDKFRIGRVKEFGEVWQIKLKQLANKNISTRAISRELGVDSKTVKKYLEEHLEIDNKKKYKIDIVRLQQYKNEIISGMKEFPLLSRTALREEFKKQYMFLYRHDKQWLMERLSPKQKKQQPTKTVDWAIRDKVYVREVKLLYKQLLDRQQPVRITVSVIGKQLGILANLERHLDKLPITKRLLDEITENIQEYQLRRCYKLIDRMLLEKETIILWKLQRNAGIKSVYFQKIKPMLEIYIKNYR
ncbi:transposase [Psychrobacillus glaciei]|uniref:Transposase n=1 Tax=Psychrobacillus glaciei TaxID=2283160 RepID=A0A5J6SRX8_9BACI|nr:TnsD family Tn7-like transposition protein [Psychrobacillus glaciei]QFG00799.1 transposase [Psychrobacillus glaciei]